MMQKRSYIAEFHIIEYFDTIVNWKTMFLISKILFILKAEKDVVTEM